MGSRGPRMSDASLPVQTFNHVAISVPASLLDAEGRASLLDFYGFVFGWTEMPTLSEDGRRLVLRAHSHEQFVFLIAADAPMRCPSGDHFGLSVRTPGELQDGATAAERRRGGARAARGVRAYLAAARRRRRAEPHRALDRALRRRDRRRARRRARARRDRHERAAARRAARRAPRAGG